MCCCKRLQVLDTPLKPWFALVYTQVTPLRANVIHERPLRREKLFNIRLQVRLLEMDQMFINSVILILWEKAKYDITTKISSKTLTGLQSCSICSLFPTSFHKDSRGTQDRSILLVAAVSHKIQTT